MSMASLLEDALEKMQKEEFLEAKKAFEQITKEFPKEPIGYVGMTYALCFKPKCPVDEVFAPIENVTDLKCSSKYQVLFEKLLNYVQYVDGIRKSNLLSIASSNYRYRVVESLVKWGADIDVLCRYNVTALWYVCAVPLEAGKEVEGRKIAELLIEHDANLYVTNDGGVALYNRTTDKKIAKMIRRKEPGIEKGGYVEKYKKKSKLPKIIFLLIVIGIVAFGIYSCEEDKRKRAEFEAESQKWLEEYSKTPTQSNSNFTNKYGSPDTTCSHSGCDKKIASSGDTNCCTTHSNRCAECNCYIDEDAMWCMSCIKKAVN